MNGGCWGRFFARAEFERHRYGAFVPSESTTDIQHGDLECRFTFPVPDGRTVDFLNYPWLRANREAPAVPYRVLTTDLTERDIVGGGLVKARQALSLAVRETPAGGKVVLNSACVPDLTGEDTAALARAHDGAVRVDHRPSAGQDMVLSALRESLRLSVCAPQPSEAARPSVILVGSGGGRAQEELRRWLGEAGVEVSACLLPCLSRACFRGAGGASLLVLGCDRLLEKASREIAAGLSLPVVRPAAPHGPRGCRRWLAAVAAAAGVRDPWTPAVARRLEQAEARWEAMSEHARGHRLAFILPQEEIARLSDPSWNAGVPLLPLLIAMGFGVDLLIDAGDGAQSPRAMAGARVSLFRTEDELSDLLEHGDFAAVYSDFYFDRRLSRRGKGQFSLAFFEPGLEGSLRSFERLLGLCRLAFYRRYRKYLR